MEEKLVNMFNFYTENLFSWNYCLNNYSHEWIKYDEFRSRCKNCKAFASTHQLEEQGYKECITTELSI